MKAVLLVIAMLLLPVTVGVGIEPVDAGIPTAGAPVMAQSGDPVQNGRGAGVGQHGSNSGLAGSGVAAGGHRWGPPQDRGPAGDPGRHGPERSTASRAVDEIRRDPSDTDLNALVRRWRFRAFRRIFGKNALEHEKRRVVYELIRSDPGIDIREIASQTGININTLRYHLGRLQSFGTIVTSEEGGVVRYYENHGRYDPLDRKRIARRWHATSARILDLVAQNPGVSRGEIAQALGISGPSATRWLKRFAKESIVKEVPDGRFVRYYPAGM